MSWITIIWSMASSACLTLAAIHLIVWWRRRAEWDILLFCLSAAAVTVYTLIELRLMHVETPAEYATALRWLHVPVWVLVVAFVAFIRSHLRAGRPWLAWTILGVRTLALLLNFMTGPNLNYRQVTGLRRVPFLGESVSIAEGVSNPWMLVGQLSLLLLLIFTADAAITAWRRGERRQALLTGGSMVFFALTSVLQSVLILWQIVDWPLTASFPFLGIVAVMGYEMSLEMIRAAQIGRELRESEQRLTMAADAANVGVWSHDIARNHVWATDKWRELFGFAKSQRLKLDDILQRVHPDDRNALGQTLSKVRTEGGSYETEYRIVRVVGEVRWIASRGRVECDGGSKPAFIRGVSLDITQRKLAEQAATQQRNELAHLSRVAMLGELSGSMAHELNQPLTAILTNAEAAAMFGQHENADMVEIRKILGDIGGAAKRAGEIIKRLRRLLKKGEISCEPLEINEACEEVLKLMRSDLINHQVTVETHFAKGLAAVLGDRVQLQQVLINLITNACDAMAGNSEADRLLVVRTEMEGENAVRISIRDYGTGIETEKLESVFESFYTSKARGMGLGLSVCRTIVLAHNGRIFATNNPEKGTSFHVIVPIDVTKVSSGPPRPILEIRALSDIEEPV